MKTTLQMIFIFFTLFISSDIKAQVELKISEMTVSNIINDNTDSTYFEGEEEGPIISLKCEIINSSDHVIDMHPSSAYTKIKFLYNRIPYIVDVSWSNFSNSDHIVINPNEYSYFEVTGYLLWGTPMLSQFNPNYTNLLLQILPTISLKYKEANLLFIFNQIEYVTIIE